MFKINIVLLFLVVLVMECSSWVFTEVNYTELKAKNLNEESETNDIEMSPQERFNLIFPGTKWCGPGDIAEGYDDLGLNKDTDMCCREHDMCPDVIPAGETKHNITNDAYYSRLSCDCDEKFRRCLREVMSKPSVILGNMYFNTIGTQCFREDYPVTGCKRKGGWLKTKCVEYEFDTTGEKQYQWFDVPVF